MKKEVKLKVKLVQPIQEICQAKPDKWNKKSKTKEPLFFKMLMFLINQLKQKEKAKPLKEEKKLKVKLKPLKEKEEDTTTE